MSGTRRSSTVISRLASMMLTAMFCLSVRAQVQAQQTHASAGDDVASAVKLYEHGDTVGAVETLRRLVKRDKENPTAWLYYGLSLNRVGQIKGARDAFEKAVKLNPKSAEARTGWAYTLLLTDKTPEALRQAERALEINGRNAVAHYIIGVARLRANEPATALKEAETALGINPDFYPSLILKSQALLGLYVIEFFMTEQPSLTGKVNPEPHRPSRLKEAFESLEKYLKVNGKADDARLWREQLEALRPYAEYENKPASERGIFTTQEVTTKAKVLTKPEPRYTVKARGAGITGTVVLRAVFAADGTVQNILLLRSLSHGLSEEAIWAAKGIKFIPATKDGKPVSQFIQIEYNFNVY